jgi:DNA polymerase zeta
MKSPWKARRNAHLEGANQSRFVHDLSDREYFFFSPSLDDANRQEALEVQALTLEPESGHIEDPIVVCDFTALYPSLIIAYNLCFSTCAGQLEYHSTREAMCIEGRTTGKVGPMSYPEDRTATILKHHLKASSADGLKKNRVYVTPSRSIYVAESVVKGVLPQVLDEILSCRAMLKKAAKMYKNCGRNIPPAVLRQLEARQLALKYVGTLRSSICLSLSQPYYSHEHC